jgi:hypothetical protein
MNDRSADVRSVFYEVLKHWMTFMEIQSLKVFEEVFILFLLNGISDEQSDISSQCRSFLEEHGKRMREALQLLHEEDQSSNHTMSQI